MKKNKKSFLILTLLTFQFFASSLIAQEIRTRSFCSEFGLYGIIDEDFNVIIPVKYFYADEFTGKYANVQLSKDLWAVSSNDSMSLLNIKTKDQVDVGNVRSITFFDENK